MFANVPDLKAFLIGQALLALWLKSTDKLAMLCLHPWAKHWDCPFCMLMPQTCLDYFITSTMNLNKRYFLQPCKDAAHLFCQGRRENFSTGQRNRPIYSESISAPWPLDSHHVMMRWEDLLQHPHPSKRPKSLYEAQSTFHRLDWRILYLLQLWYHWAIPSKWQSYHLK